MKSFIVKVLVVVACRAEVSDLAAPNVVCSEPRPFHYDPVTNTLVL